MIFYTPVIVKYIKRNLNITKPRYSEQSVPVSSPFVISRFYCICKYNLHSVKRPLKMSRLDGRLWEGVTHGGRVTKVSNEKRTEHVYVCKIVAPRTHPSISRVHTEKYLQFKYAISIPEKISICLIRGRNKSLDNVDVFIVHSRKYMYEMVRMTSNRKYPKRSEGTA